jgi:rubrerythrin
MERSIPELVRVREEERDTAWLTESLQSAIALEFSTIPLYLSAYFSIQSPNPGDPNSAAGLLESIFVEEMLHLGLTCNMLASLGGEPDIVGAVPTYQRRGLPGGVLPNLYVTLAGLTPDRLTQLFMAIEYPEGGPVTAAALQTYPTIGAFYDAITAAFTQQQPLLTPGKQLAFPTSGDPWLSPILTPNDFLTAIRTIKEQGEGTSTSPDAPDFGNELAHYYKFGSIANGKLYVKTDTGWSYSGAAVPFPTVYPLMEVPIGGYPHPPAGELAFNQQFTQLVNTLQQAWNTGGSEGNTSLSNAIGMMPNLTSLAAPLAQQNYCPTFEYLIT